MVEAVKAVNEGKINGQAFCQHTGQAYLRRFFLQGVAISEPGAIEIIHADIQPGCALIRIDDVILNARPVLNAIADEERRNAKGQSDFEQSDRMMFDNPSLDEPTLELGDVRMEWKQFTIRGSNLFCSQNLGENRIHALALCP